MSDYTHLNLKQDVDDQAPNFGLSPDMEFRMARVPLDMENGGVSYLRKMLDVVLFPEIWQLRTDL